MKCCILLAIILINITLSLQFSFLAPILPLEIKRRQISQVYTGLITGAICVGYILCPYFVTQTCYPRFGRRGTTLLGFMLMSVSLLLYGLAYFIPDSQKELFIICSLLTRLIEGCGLGASSAAMVSLTIRLFPDEVGTATSARFFGSYSGDTIGEVLGALVRDKIGYFQVFISSSVFISLSSLLVFIFQEDRSEERRDHSIRYRDLMKIRRVYLVMMSCFTADLLHYSLESILAVKLRQDFSYSTTTIGLFFGIFLCGTVIMAAFSFAVPEKWEKRILIIILVWINACSALLIGPSQILQIPNNPVIIGIGLFLGGSTRTLTGAYLVVEAIKVGVSAFQNQEDRVRDLVSSIYTTGQGVTLLLSPIIGSALLEVIGFRLTLDVEALVFVLTSLVYTIYTISDLRREKKEGQMGEGGSTGEEEEEEPMLDSK